ncbi:carbamoyltransferase C-terminal domain-containing protein [Actinomycetes bacterium KLBMP 9797]
MRVLGIGGSIHDFCACLVVEGEVVFAVEEERLTRVKQAFGLGPELARCRAADVVLEAAGIGLDGVDMVIANDFLNPVYATRFQDRVQWIGHHLSHAASTFYTSPFDSAAVLVMDGRGSTVPTGAGPTGETITFYTGDSTGLHVVRQQLGRVMGPDEDPFEDSIGRMYEEVSKSIGFIQKRSSFAEPGKTMGLAPYGGPRYLDAVAATFHLGAGEFRQSSKEQAALRELIAAELAAAGDAPARERVRADFAYAVQAHTERIVIELASWLHQQTGERRLCLAGGVALNSVTNYRLLTETPFEELYVFPAAGDNGTAIGAALYGYHEVAGHPRKVSDAPFSPYLGRCYSPADIDAALAGFAQEVRWERRDDLYDHVAAALAAGAIVGWFQGRAEIGPRALGNRSILADPRAPGMKDHINAKVKHREAFRPFAPVVLESRQREFFTSEVPAYYMLLVPDVVAEHRQTIPAVTHVDGSARLQTATPALNRPLCELLSAFDRITGVPVLLNTSFNDNNEPIVETPSDALRCFLNTEMDLLVIEDRVIRKS